MEIINITHKPLLRGLWIAYKNQIFHMKTNTLAIKSRNIIITVLLIFIPANIAFAIEEDKIKKLLNDYKLAYTSKDIETIESQLAESFQYIAKVNKGGSIKENIYTKEQYIKNAKKYFRGKSVVKRYEIELLSIKNQDDYTIVNTIVNSRYENGSCNSQCKTKVKMKVQEKYNGLQIFKKEVSAICSNCKL